MDDDSNDKNEPRKMLTMREVLDIVPIARTTLERLVRLKQFPKPTYISNNRRIWYADQIVEWQRLVDNSQPERRRGRPRSKTRSGAAA
jgi:prophage regulatory protein